ncbi:MAG: hypothetical protein F6J93_34740 [Oscillatoria sp. SIO1A7]|nr:hypothetical protein [Oscillatoria sp. SIO1A7]
MSRTSSFILLVFAFLLGLFVVRSEPEKKGSFIVTTAVEKEPWPIKLGMRMLILRSRIPTVDRVVLVPDEATFLKAIQQWSLDGRWPILIEDDRYTPIFLRRFEPKETIRLPAVTEPLPEGEERRSAAQAAVASTWNAEDFASLQETWAQLGWKPPGVAIASAKDPAWPAAVALAAAWGQPLVFLPDFFGKPNDSLSPKQWQNLQKKVEGAVAKTGYSYRQLGDEIDTVTIVRQLAVKYESPQNPKQDWAVTDGLGRHENGERWAAIGWIYGSAERSLYQAMCSIFLDPDNVLFYDSYPPEEPWNDYAVGLAKYYFNKVGFKVKVVQRPEASQKTWRELAAEGFNFDLIFTNSKGMPNSFAVGGDRYGSVRDIPKLLTPAAIHFIHSWSATTPDDPNTIAGRWLEKGAYAYVGSVHEPYLSAFITPTLMTRRLLLSAPFLISARQLNFSPWKITTIGDPLMMLTQTRRRLPPTAAPLTGEF